MKIEKHVIIITPLYGVSKELMGVLDTHQDCETIDLIITDDISPVFSIDLREHWLKHVYFGKELKISSITSYDEEERFLEEVNQVIDHIYHNGGEDFTDNCVEILFATPDCHENVYGQFGLIIKEKSPLDQKIKDDLNPLFVSRYGWEFDERTNVTPREIPTVDTLGIMPCIVDANGVRYYGLSYPYGKGKEYAQPFLVEVPHSCPVAQLSATMEATAQVVFNLTDFENCIALGNTGGVSFWTPFKHADAPNCELSFMAEDCDIFWVPSTTIKYYESPLLDWLIARHEERIKAEAEQFSEGVVVDGE